MAPEFKIVVQKFGGSSVADAPRIKSVAAHIKSSLTMDLRIVVVVSAMGHTTNELIALASQVSNDPPKREMDMLISCGERSSMALLAMALNAIGVSAISLTGSQSGIITDDNHSGAEIIAIKPKRVLDALVTHQVVIIAGFQGVSEQKEITTLRRGGSDTTAVAMAAAINAQLCEIYTDVTGVMDIDPRIVSCAQIIPRLDFAQMESMALYGAKVLAHDAIRLAQQFGVTLTVKKTGDSAPGTEIRSISMADSSANRIAITHLRALIRLTMPAQEFARMKVSDGYFLCGLERGEKFVAYLSNDISQELTNQKSSKIDPALALVTIHFGRNQMALSTISHLRRIMVEQKIICEDLIVSGKEIFVIIKDQQLNHALAHFHRALCGAEANL